MNKMLLYGAAGILTMVAVVMATAMVTFAASGSNSSVSFVNAGSVPVGSRLALNIHYKVTNDEDSGNAGYWALDSYSKTVQVWQEPDGAYYVVASYDGTWKTFAGALSPGNGVTENTDAHGTMHGGYVGTFTANGVTCKNGDFGTHDLGGTEADILLGTYGNGQTGNANSYSYLSNCFSDASNFQYINWGWTYTYRGQRWNNFQSATSGDIVS